jgi:hypothetical protein
VGSFDFEPGEGLVRWVGVEVGSDGLPVAFQSDRGGWKLIACDDWACTNRTTSMIDVGETHFWLPASIQFAPDGLPVFTTQATEGGLPMTIHACEDRACTQGDQTEFPTDQGGWVAVSETGRTLIGIMDGEPMLRLFHSETPDGFSLTEVSGHPYWGRSLKVAGDGDSYLILAHEASPVGLLRALVIECDTECAEPTETRMGEIGIFEATLDPMAAPRAGTSAFLAGSNSYESPGLMLVTWQNDPAQAVQVHLDGFPAEHGEIQGAAVAIGPSGNPVVVWNRVYYERDLGDGTELLVARCDNPDCTTGTIATLFQGVENASAGGHVDVAVGPDDCPVLIYDNWNLTTKESEITLTRCVDPACTDTAVIATTWSNR